MSTKSQIDPNRATVDMSPIRASAITLSCGPRVKHNPSMDSLYQMAASQSTTIVTDVPMADPRSLGLSSGHDRVIVSFTGQDVARSAWARLIAPQPAEIQRNPSLLDTKDRIERLTREVNFKLLQMDLIHTEVYFGKNSDLMGKIHFIAPVEYAKLAYDLNLNFIQCNPETKLIYDRSKKLPIPDLWLVCYPDWVNPVWQAWRNRVGPADMRKNTQDPEPKRIMMTFDIPHSTAYLLGARYFGEVKKACLTMIWDAAISAGIGMPIHGSAKTIYLKPRPKGVQNGVRNGVSRTEEIEPVDVTSEERPQEEVKTTAIVPHATASKAELEGTTFITIGLSGSGKSTLGCDPHKEYLREEDGEHIHIGNDDALVILNQPESIKRATVGLESGSYNKSNDYTPGSFYLKTVQSAENVMVARGPQGRLLALHQDILNGNGRVQTARHMLPGADQNLDTPWPDYISLLMKDETLPPLLMIEEPTLLVSMYMCLATRSTTAENIPISEMNKLKMVPGANPFNTWGLQQEAECLEEIVGRIKCKGLILNTGGYFIDAENMDAGHTQKVTKELSLSIYPMLARGLVKWVKWEHFPGVPIPAPGTFDHVYPNFEKEFNPLRMKDSETYYELLRQRLIERQNFLLGLRIDRRFVLPIRKAIIEIDTRELEVHGRSSHVDNIDTFLDTGRDTTSY